jgi:hypothetical protein
VICAPDVEVPGPEPTARRRRYVPCAKILRTVSPAALRSALLFIRLVYLFMVRIFGWLVLLGGSDVDTNGHRSHQSLQQEPPRQPGRAVDISARIERRQVLGALTSEYRRAA